VGGSAYAPPGMARRSPARFLAPVALATCAVAAYAVVHAGTKHHHADVTPPAATAKARTTKAARPKHKTYTVKSGDVLSGIAEKTGVTLARLKTLNPKMNAETLHPGQKIKLR